MVSSEPGLVHISILDTQKLPRGTFLLAVTLLNVCSIEGQDELVHDYYCEEYLSKGRLNLFSGIMAMTTSEAFIDCGLYELYPPFADEA